MKPIEVKKTETKTQEKKKGKKGRVIKKSNRKREKDNKN
jgi:hypothetical protein